jgi:hypothetical protein
MEKKRFYATGLKFSCKRCSACCRYETGTVFLSEKDLENISLALNMDKNSVIKTYCRWVTDWKGEKSLSLKEKSNKDCILWNEGCIIYSARPLQCISFPFWESILVSSESWEVAATGCPGMNDGELHSNEAITKYRNMRSSEPIINKTHSIQYSGGDL